MPAADWLITLDADSILLPEYALILVHEMLPPGGDRTAVAQTPYNTIPNPPRLLERVAGATTDIQYLIRQGFTYYGGTYWVGANALLRSAALQDIRGEIEERGFRFPVFIQNRTVIEDTSRASISSRAAGHFITIRSVLHTVRDASGLWFSPDSAPTLGQWWAHHSAQALALPRSSFLEAFSYLRGILPDSLPGLARRGQSWASHPARVFL